MLAKHKNSKAKVAIKLMKKASIAKMHSKCGEAFQEVSVLQEVTAFKIPNVLYLIDQDEDDEYIILVTEYLAGRSLYDYVDSFGGYALSEKKVKSIVRDVA